MWPKDESIAKRLKRDPRSSEARRLSELHRFRREVAGLTSAYEHVLKAVDSDKPYADVYLQGRGRVPTGYQPGTNRAPIGLGDVRRHFRQTSPLMTS